MKCNSCGAINSSSITKCEFCGTDLYTAGVEKTGHIPVTFFEDSLNLIKELSKTPSVGFNWWAFFFPVAFLGGYGGKANAQKIALVILIPVLAFSLIGYVSYRAANLIALVSLCWTFYVSYMVATRQSQMVKKERPFDMTTAIIFEVVYLIAYAILESL